MAEPHIGPYNRVIMDHLGCSADEAAMVEDIMRNEVFHSTLDWQTAEQLRQGTREAWAILQADRDFFEDHYREVQCVFEEMKQNERHHEQARISASAPK